MGKVSGYLISQQMKGKVGKKQPVCITLYMIVPICNSWRKAVIRLGKFLNGPGFAWETVWWHIFTTYIIDTLPQQVRIYTPFFLILCFQAWILWGPLILLPGKWLNTDTVLTSTKSQILRKHHIVLITLFINTKLAFFQHPRNLLSYCILYFLCNQIRSWKMFQAVQSCCLLLKTMD